jgi:hypothetical protein
LALRQAELQGVVATRPRRLAAARLALADTRGLRHPNKEKGTSRTSEANSLPRDRISREKGSHPVQALHWVFFRLVCVCVVVVGGVTYDIYECVWCLGFRIRVEWFRA